jgi:hypothetical protein
MMLSFERSSAVPVVEMAVLLESAETCHGEARKLSMQGVGGFKCFDCFHDFLNWTIMETSEEIFELTDGVDTTVELDRLRAFELVGVMSSSVVEFCIWIIKPTGICLHMSFSVGENLWVMLDSLERDYMRKFPVDDAGYSSVHRIDHDIAEVEVGVCEVEGFGFLNIIREESTDVAMSQHFVYQIRAPRARQTGHLPNQTESMLIQVIPQLSRDRAKTDAYTIQGLHHRSKDL